jgi:hypothetical protein
MSRTTVVVIFLVLIDAIILTSFGSYLYQIRIGDSLIVSNIPIRVSTSTTVVTIAGWNTCNYPSFGFRFQYPHDWEVFVFSSHADVGIYPINIRCGDIDASQLDPEITIAPSPNRSLPSGGMRITEVAPIQVFKSYGTATIAGQEAFFQPNGSIVVGNYKLSFSSSTPTSTRDSILRTFQFLSK